MKLSDMWRKILAQFPVIGPQAEIEEPLLLSGQKPLGWVSLMPPFVDEKNPEVQKKIDYQRQLDAAIDSGRLKAKDVVSLTVIARVPNVVKMVGDREMPDREWVSRHYCQPEREKDLEVMAAFNQASFNRQPVPADMLDKSFGEYLGYRKRDEAYWNFMCRNGYKVPTQIQDALAWFNVNVAQKAYNGDILRQAEERNKNLPALAKPEGTYLDECVRKALQGDTGMQTELGNSAWWQRDYAAAEKWFRRAATAGDPVGQHNVGVMYQNGDGVPQDKVEAYFWKLLATTSKLNFYKPDSLTDAAAQLTGEQRAGVQKRLAEWKPEAPGPAALAAPRALPALPKPAG